MNNGIAIQRIVIGFARITLPLKENNSTKVTRSAMIVTGVNICRNFSLNHCLPL